MGTLPAWIDPEELDELERRYPDIARRDLALVLQAHWPIRNEVERAIRELREDRGL
jgi:hypothetical protein